MWRIYRQWPCRANVASTGRTSLTHARRAKDVVADGAGEVKRGCPRRREPRSTTVPARPGFQSRMLSVTCLRTAWVASRRVPRQCVKTHHLPPCDDGGLTACLLWTVAPTGSVVDPVDLGSMTSTASPLDAP
ncbi:hypothetical protein SBD_1618 [Streptomyces bottropensis ATCC 25435]|uniref:Uncharacterized protein n=1 Tax=Streptomyces bottropensis ATCC 25435 TaxID=1054862 RepID=M3DJR9_9ACTN|nr:hypothetical protein SBD_1618 [Streptomyces bottropensis ATCC 25435]